MDNSTGIGEHLSATGHTICLDNAQLLSKEESWYSRKVKEAIYIKTQRPPLNRDQGLRLPNVYNTILLPERRPPADTRHNTRRDQGP